MTSTKVIIPLLLVASLLTACDDKKSEKSIEKESEPNTTTTVVTQTSEMEDIAIDFRMLYDEIIKQYDTYTQDKVDENKNLNAKALLVYEPSYTGLYYFEQDIDNNSIPELMIALKNKSGDFSLIDLYTISDDNELIRLTEHEHRLKAIGKGMTLQPLKNGNLLFSGSGSGEKRHYVLYEFKKDSSGLSPSHESSTIDELIGYDEPLNLSELPWKPIFIPEQTDRVQETTESETITSESISSEIDETTKAMNVAALANGNYTSIIGKWRNQKGNEIEIIDNRVHFSTDTPGWLIDSSTFHTEELPDGPVTGTQLRPEEGSGASITFVPINSNFSEMLVSGATDTSRDRILITQSPGTPAEEVYYRTN